MKIEIKKVLNGWTLYTLQNKQKMAVSVLNFGGIITEILVPNRMGAFENVVLKYKDYQEYEQNPYYFGAIIGRTAGRIENASFKINNENFKLRKNEGDNHIHGGTTGFHNVIWEVTPFENDDTVGVRLNHASHDLSNGYPGNVEVSVTYTLTNQNELIVDYEGTTDKDTILTLTNHSYFNLSGNTSRTVHNHEVKMSASNIIELDEQLIPTGKKLNVSNTTFDFNKGRKIDTGIRSTHIQNKIASNGYDHYFIFDNNDPIIVKEKISGRKLTIHTNQPGVVMYTANTLSSNIKLADGQSKPHIGICFETQGTPASLHHKGFPSIILKAEETYKKRTSFKFDTFEI